MHLCGSVLCGTNDYSGKGETPGEDPTFSAEICRSLHWRSRPCRNHADPGNRCSIPDTGCGRSGNRPSGCLRRYLETAWRIDGRFHVFCKIRGAGRCKPLLRMCGASFCRNLFPEQRDPQDRKDHVRGNGSSVFCRLSYHSAESVVSRNAQTGGDSQSFCVYSHLSAFENKL